MVDSGFTFNQNALDAMAGVMNRSVKWVIMRIPEGGDSGCEVVAQGT